MLKWVIGILPPGEKSIALAMDATSLSDTFTILVISFLYRGSAIPVAWAVMKAHDSGSWQPRWLGLLAELREVVPPEWFVLVAADRGLYADWLFKAIVAQGWHPFLRINARGKYRCLNRRAEKQLADVVPHPNSTWSGRVDCFKYKPLRCTLLATWKLDCPEPCLVLTDLPPKRADLRWYKLRIWIESGFKDLKRGGLQWHHTRIKDPARTERVWLALALATLMLIAVGSEPEEIAEQPDQESSGPTTRAGGRAPLSCLVLGQLRTLAALYLGKNLAPMRLNAQTWSRYDTS